MERGVMKSFAYFKFLSFSFFKLISFHFSNLRRMVLNYRMIANSSILFIK